MIKEVRFVLCLAKRKLISSLCFANFSLIQIRDGSSLRVVIANVLRTLKMHLKI